MISRAASILGIELEAEAALCAACLVDASGGTRRAGDRAGYGRQGPRTTAAAPPGGSGRNASSTRPSAASRSPRARIVNGVATRRIREHQRRFASRCRPSLE